MSCPKPIGRYVVYATGTGKERAVGIGHFALAYSLNELIARGLFGISNGIGGGWW